MAYVTVPKDLTKIKSKMLFGLTKRQLVCFGSAALVGVPLFFLSKGSMGTTPAALCMILVMGPRRMRSELMRRKRTIPSVPLK